MSQSFGAVKGDGNIDNTGSGDWLVQKGPGSGNYTIDFAYPRPYVPVVVVGGYNTNTSPVGAKVLFSAYKVSVNSFCVIAMDSAGAGQDADFSFIAVW